MARIFITGSSDGLGALSAKLLLSEGHNVVLHARNADRAKSTQQRIPGAEGILTGDLSDIDETKALAKKVNELGRFDAVIHNAGVYETSREKITTVNLLAPYILTSLITQPSRLVYLSSGMHLSGRVNLKSIADKSISYSDSKLYIVMLAMAVARKWKDCYSNAVDPGWVPTKMGGHGAPDDLQKGYETQSWLSVSNDPKAMVSGKYFHHKHISRHNAAADDLEMQDQLIETCEKITSVKFIS